MALPGKTQFAGARVTFGGEIRTPQRFLPESAHPQGRKFAKYQSKGCRVLGHVGPGRIPWHLRNPRPRPKTEKHNFPVLGALLGGGSGRPKRLPTKVRDFFLNFTIWPTGPPRAGNRRNWVFRPFWPATLKKFQAESGKTQFPGARDQMVFYQKERNTHPSARS